MQQNYKKSAAGNIVLFSRPPILIHHISPGRYLPFFIRQRFILSRKYIERIAQQTFIIYSYRLFGPREIQDDKYLFIIFFSYISIQGFIITHFHFPEGGISSKGCIVFAQVK